MNIDNIAYARDPRYDLVDAIKAVNEEYYYVGDGNHMYAFFCITKELGDLVLDKCGKALENYGTYLNGIDCYDISETDITGKPLTFEEFWNEELKYIPDFKKYETFEDFKKGEGFE